MTTTTTTTTTNNNNNNNSTFMKLNLDQLPDRYRTKILLQHQCYRLVPDNLLNFNDDDNDDDDLNNENLIELNENLNENDKNKYNENKIDNNITPYDNKQQKNRRKLPKIPSDQKPFSKIWKMSINNNNNGDNLEKNLRWKLTMANMLLEIKTDSFTGKTLSIQMINDDAGDDLSKSNKNQNDDQIISDQIIDDQSMINNTSSDSGISSNIDSPSNTFYGDEIKMDEEKFKSNQLQMNYKATHRVLFKFCSRHSDEINLEIGDEIFVFKEFDDQWSDGLNLRTGKRGIFPSSLIIDLNYSEFMFDNSNSESTNNSQNLINNQFIDFRIQRELFQLNFIGSIEVFKSKGEDVLNESIKRISNGIEHEQHEQKDIPFNCLIEVSDIGIRMIDNDNVDDDNVKNVKKQKRDYFFALIQITYCGYQCNDDNGDCYFAFITRHPTIQKRFACHVFQCNDYLMVKNLAESVGRAFYRFYNRFVQITVPTI